MRPSIAPARQAPSNAALAAKLLEKKKECEAIMALEKASAKFAQRMEELANDFDVVADAGKVHGEVLEQWPDMFRILNLFLSSRHSPAEGGEETTEQIGGERLVRVPIEGISSNKESSL